MPSHTPIDPVACAAKIRAARRIAVLTGAGLSTAAGVPDFRGPRGLYVTRRYDPESVFEIHAFDRDPAPFYAFSRDFLGLLASIEATYTHSFLAALEERSGHFGLITQNIDGLHQRAGSRRVFPIHGDYESAHCRRCNREYTRETVQDLMAGMAIPRCGCGGVIKPDVVLFGENVHWLAEAEELAQASDLMLVLGSSLAVYPAAALPSQAGGDTVIVNRGPVGMRPAPGVFVADAELDGFFREVAAELGW